MKRAWLVAALSSMLVACAGDGFQSDFKDPTDTSSCRTSDIETIYADVDMDGYGDPATGVEGCITSSNFVNNDGDCNDNNPLVYTGAIDMCGDKVDNDCSGADACATALNAHWTFSESSGETVGDESGNLLNGLLVNGLLHTAGASLTFDGADDYVEIPNAEVLQSATGTVSLWFMPTLIGIEQAILSKDAGNRGPGGQLSIYFDTNGSVRARLESNQEEGDYEVASIPMPLNRWHHIALTFGGNQGMTMYIDDIVAGKNAYTGGLARNAEPIAIGAGTDNSGDLTVLPYNKPFAGKIAQVQLYNRQLLREELTSLKLVTDPRTSGL